MKALIKQDIGNNVNLVEDDEVRFIYLYNSSSLIFPIEDSLIGFENNKELVKQQNERMSFYRKNFISNKRDILFLDKQLVKGKFKSFSRIDGCPIIEIDTSLIQLRDDKIDEILY